MHAFCPGLEIELGGVRTAGLAPVHVQSVQTGSECVSQVNALKF